MHFPRAGISPWSVPPAHARYTSNIFFPCRFFGRDRANPILQVSVVGSREILTGQGDSLFSWSPGVWVRQRKSNTWMIQPFAEIRLPHHISPVSAGRKNQRALNFTVPARCSATQCNHKKCIASLPCQTLFGIWTGNQSRKILIRYHLKHPFIGSSASH